MDTLVSGSTAPAKAGSRLLAGVLGAGSLVLVARLEFIGGLAGAESIIRIR
jgi:hypothetical protein